MALTYDNRTNPWERQKGETPRQYIQFTLYRDHGVDRSLRKVFDKEYLKNTKAIQNPDIKRVSLMQAGVISSANDWVARAEKYDIYMEKKLRKENEEAIRKMRKKYAMLASGMSAFAGTALQMLQSKLSKQKGKDALDLEALGNLTNAEIRSYIKEAMAMERFGLGDTEKTVEQTNVEKKETQTERLLPIIPSEKELDEYVKIINKKED